MVEVRRLTAQDDLDAVACLYAQSWKASYRGLLPDTFLNRLTPDRWSAMLHADPGASLGLFVDGALTGTAMVGFARQAGREGYGEIISIYLRPGFAGRGYGRALMEAALSRLSEEGCERACLWTLEGNVRAEGFYARMGFAPSGNTQQENFGGQSARLYEYTRDLP